MKVRSVRSNWVLLAAAVALVAAFALLSAGDAAGRSSRLGDLTVGLNAAVLLLGAFGVQVIGQEYRFNTIRPTFTAAPRRLRVLAAKAAVAAAVAAAATAAMVAVCALVGAVATDGFGLDGTDWRIVWSAPLFAAGWTVYGTGIGAVVRQPVAGIVIVTVQGIVVEPLLTAYVGSLGPWVPFQNGAAMLSRTPADPGLYRTPFAGGVYFFVFTAAVVALGGFLVNHRDA